MIMTSESVRILKAYKSKPGPKMQPVIVNCKIRPYYHSNIWEILSNYTLHTVQRGGTLSGGTRQLHREVGMTVVSASFLATSCDLG